MDPLYKIGDKVRSRYAKASTFYISEIQTQECPAGVQIFYLVRQFSVGRMGGISKELIKVRTDEVEAIPEPSPELQKMIDELDRIVTEKMKFLKDQDFEGAAGLRKEENELRMRIEEQADLEFLDSRDLIKRI